MKTKLILFLSILSIYLSAAPWDGTTKTMWNSVSGVNDGTSADKPFLINTSENLAKLAEMVNAGTSYSGQFFKLTSNLDLGNQNWTCIGDANPFSGNFDGAGHSISNLSITKWSNNIGLFGTINSATIKNLGIESGTITCGGSNAGAIVGTATGAVGNLSTISNCYNKASVTYGATDPRVYIGGIAGILLNNSWLDHCYNYANVTNDGSASSNYTGGIAGGVANGSTVYSCYSVGVVASNNTKGGAIGAQWSSAVSVYYDADVCTGTNAATQAMGSGANTADVTGFTTATMKDVAFVATLNHFGESDWKVKSGDYPTLTSSLTTFMRATDLSSAKIIGRKAMIEINEATVGNLFTITNFIGSLVSKGFINGTSVQVPVKNAGVYLVQIGKNVTKIIVE